MSTNEAHELRELHKIARREGFAIDYRRVQPISQCRLPPIDPITDIREPFVFSSDDDLPKLPEWNYPAEKFIVDKKLGAIDLIASVIEHNKYKDPEIDLWEERPYTLEDQYLEEPVVRAEYEVSANEIFKTPKLRYEEFDRAEIDEAADEGLGWSENIRKEIAEYEKKVLVEKLDMDPSSLKFLEEIQKMNIESISITEDIGRPYIPPISGPLTSPLLPMSELDSPKLPPLEDFRNEVKPEPETGDSYEEPIDDILKPFVEASETFPDCGVTEEPISAFDVTEEPISAFVNPNIPTSSPMRRPPASEEYEIEVPLSPPISPNKQVRFSSVIQTDKGLYQFSKAEDSQDEGLESLENRPEIMKFEQELIQEQLQEADSKLRIKVPIMDFARRKMPWEDTKNNLRKIEDLKSWAGVAAKKLAEKKSEEFELQWVPFNIKAVQSELPKDSPLEEHGNEVSQFILGEKEADTAENQLIESVEGFGFYSQDEEENDFEEELEYGNFEPKNTLPPIPIEECFRPKEVTPGPILIDEDGVLLSVKETVKKRKKTMTQPPELGQTAKKRLNNPHNDRFSAANMLRSFMAARGGSIIPEVIESSIKDPSSSSIPATPPQKGNIQSQKPTPVTLAPRLNPNPKPFSFIVSTVLLSQRIMFRRIKELYKNAKFVERDYSGIFTSEDSADDAELILAPKIGMIHTTLQKLQQRPLPGEPSAFTSGIDLKRRIQRLHVKYERLIIIVWNPSTSTLTKSDSDTIASFDQFAAKMNQHCRLTVQNVQGPESSIAHWTALAMMNLGQQFDFIEEENKWELALRDAGLNAYAAQAIMARFRRVEWFFDLPPEKKIESVEGIVGEKVIRRVVRNLEYSQMGRRMS